MNIGIIITSISRYLTFKEDIILDNGDVQYISPSLGHKQLMTMPKDGNNLMDSRWHKNKMLVYFIFETRLQILN